jgi:hypothetical protein
VSAVGVDEAALGVLAERYANGADRNDTELFVSAFAPDATLEVFMVGSEEIRSTYHGHDELRRIPGVLARYRRTFHMVGNRLYEADGDTVRGEVYCMAHHLSDGEGGPSDFVMYIRYLDRYAPGEGGEWRIVSRQVRTEWTETRPVDP